MTQTADSQSSTRPARRDVLEKHRSLWLHEALGDEPDAPPLTGRTSADVCIVGGGFVGLWTAYWLKQWDPGCDVVVLESDICGGGASGRNGGFVLSWWAKFPSLEKLLGSTDAIEVCRQSAAAIDEIGEIAGRHGIDAQFTKGGWLWTARTPSQLGAWDETVEATAAAAPGMFIELSDAEVGQRAGSPGIWRACWSRALRLSIRDCWCGGCAASAWSSACGSTSTPGCRGSPAASLRYVFAPAAARWRPSGW